MDDEDSEQNFVIVKQKPKRRRKKKPQVIELNLSSESEDEDRGGLGKLIVQVVKDSHRGRYRGDYYRRKFPGVVEAPPSDLAESASFNIPVNSTYDPHGFVGYQWDGLLTHQGPYYKNSTPRHHRSRRDFDPSHFDYYDEPAEVDDTIRKADKKAVFSVPRRPIHSPASNYTKWSRWSKCSSKCTTRRTKRCRAKQFCGNDVVREVAYCYTEGSFCHEWIGNQLQSANALEAGRGLTAPTKPQSSRRSGQMARRRSFNDVNECGIPLVRDKKKNNLWKMLKIIGGKSARKGQWPWQVAILNRFKEAFCGGTLISPYW